MTSTTLKTLPAIVGGFVLLLVAAPTQAHHSFAAEFDHNRPLVLEGVLTKIDWINPHGWWYVDVVDKETGETVNWRVQSESPTFLRRAGITRENIGKPGDKVKILAYGARDATKGLAICRVLTNETSGLVFKMLSDYTK